MGLNKEHPQWNHLNPEGDRQSTRVGPVSLLVPPVDSHTADVHCTSQGKHQSCAGRPTEGLTVAPNKLLLCRILVSLHLQQSGILIAETEHRPCMATARVT